MKAICTLIFVLLAGTAYGQSNLPANQESYTKSRWSNSFVYFTFANGNYDSLNTNSIYLLSLESTNLNS